MKKSRRSLPRSFKKLIVLWNSSRLKKRNKTTLKYFHKKEFLKITFNSKMQKQPNNLLKVRTKFKS